MEIDPTQTAQKPADTTTETPADSGNLYQNIDQAIDAFVAQNSDDPGVFGAADGGLYGAGPMADVQPPPAPAAAEPPPAPAPPAESETDRLLRVMEQERYVREREQAARAREEEARRLQTQAEQTMTATARYKQLAEAYESGNVNAVAEALGQDPLKLAQELQNGEVDTARILRREFDQRLKAMQAEQQKAVEELKQERQALLMDQARGEVMQALSEHSPFLAALGPVNPNLADEVIDAYATLRRESGKDPGLPTVIANLEKRAREQATRYVEAVWPLLDTDARARLGAPQAPQGEGAPVTTPPQRKPQLTLTHQRGAEARDFSEPPKLTPESPLDDYFSEYGL